MPKDVAPEMRERRGRQGLILEVHYFTKPTPSTRTPRAEVLGNLPKGTRKNEAAVHFTGGENIRLPPMSNPKAEGICNPVGRRE